MSLETLLNQVDKDKKIFHTSEFETCLLDYITNNESVLDKNIKFIEQFMFNATKLATKKPELFDKILLKKMFSYAEEVINNFQKKYYYSETDISKLEDLQKSKIFIMFSQSDLCSLIFEEIKRTENKEKEYWLKKGFEIKIDSANKGKDIGFLPSIQAYGFASKKFAIPLYEITGKLSWLKKSFEYNLKSAKLSENICDYLDHAIHSYGFAANSAKKIYLESKEHKWLNIFYNTELELANITRKSMVGKSGVHNNHEYYREYAYANLYAGNALRTIFLSDGNYSDGLKVTQLYQRFLNYCNLNSQDSKSNMLVPKILKKKNEVFELCELSKPEIKNISEEDRILSNQYDYIIHFAKRAQSSECQQVNNGEIIPFNS